MGAGDLGDYQPSRGVGGNAVAINWAPVISGDTSPLEGLAGDVTLTVSGLVRLNLGGYVLAAGGFTLGKSSGSNVTLGSNGSVSFDLLTIDLTGVNLFVGVGASFAGETGVIVTTTGSDATLSTVATGFLASGANLSVAMAKSTAANDTRRWTGIAASAASMSGVGLPDTFTVEVKSLSVKYNAAWGTSPSGGAVAVDWAPVISGTTSPLEGLAATRWPSIGPR